LRGSVVDHLGLDSPLGEVELDHEADEPYAGAEGRANDEL
jgi:hypothetical protein